MGNKLASQTTTAEYYLHDLDGIVFERSIGNGRLLKTLKCLHAGSAIVVKVYVKRPPYNDLKEYSEHLTAIRAKLSSLPHRNVFPFPKFVESEKAGYLIRQYFAYSLLDRINTRPFLRTIEKKWIAYQLLRALEQAHGQGVCHGDIKAENVMVTSWNWIYLTDFATAFKPAIISEHDISYDFSFYFDTSGNRTCNLAPERIYAPEPGVGIESRLVPKHDIFSLGCVIATLFLDGAPLFNFSELLSYRKGEFDPMNTLNRIPCTEARNLVMSMIAVNPDNRLSATEYLANWSSEFGMPEYFPFMHQYIAELMKMNPDERVMAVSEDQATLFQMILGVQLPENESDFAKTAEELARSRVLMRMPLGLPREYVDSYLSYSSNLAKNGAKLLYDTDSLMQELQTSVIGNSSSSSSSGGSGGGRFSALRSESTNGLDSTPIATAASAYSSASSAGSETGGGQPEEASDEEYGIITPSTSSDSFPPSATDDLPSPIPSVSLSSSSSAAMPSATATIEWMQRQQQLEMKKQGEGLMIVLSAIWSCLRDVRTPSVRCTALNQFVRFSEFLDDRCKLQRLVPYIIAMVQDPAALVRSVALSTLTTVVTQIEDFPPSDSHVFPEYILPVISNVVNDTEELTREAFARQLAPLAEVAKRFLDCSQAFHFASQPTALGGSNGSGGSGGGSGGGGGGGGSNNQGVLVALTEGSSDSGTWSSFDSELREIQNRFHDLVNDVLKDESPNVKRTLLRDITRLAAFFGRELTTDFLLPRVISLLNDRSWELRCDFCDSIVGIAVFVGKEALELYIFPCLVQALHDEEEFVTESAVKCIEALCAAQLFRTPMVFEVTRKISPLLCHPNIWIRYRTIAAITTIAGLLDPIDTHSFLLPTIQPFLSGEVSVITELELLETLRPPLSRSTFDQAVRVCIEVTKEMESAPPALPHSLSTSALPNLLPSTPSLASASAIPISSSSSRVTVDAVPMADPKLTIAQAVSPIPPPTIGASDAHLRRAISPRSIGEPQTAIPIFGTPTSPQQQQQQQQQQIDVSTVDPFMNRFRLSLGSIGITGEQRDIAMNMAPYLRSIMRTSRRSQIPDLSASLGSEVTEGYADRDRTIPVHTVTLPYSDAAQEEWSLLTNARNSTPASALPVEIRVGNRLRTYNRQRRPFSVPDVDDELDVHASRRYGAQVREANSVGDELSRRLLPPPPPPLGELRRMDNGSPYPVSYEPLRTWQPTGLLVATLHEHSAAVSQLAVSADNQFILSASDDGTVKLWDCQRLEKNVTNRSRQTHIQGGKVSCVTMLEHSHTAASGSDNASIHVFRVEYAVSKKDLITYSNFATVRQIDEAEGAIRAIDHYNTNSQSIIVYATSKGNIRGWDLRSSAEAWCLANQTKHGVVQCMTLDPNSNWLLVGTNRGCYTCWDLRFNLPLRTWFHPTETSYGIQRLANYNSGSGTEPWVWATSGSNCVYLWDLETGLCRKVIRVLSASHRRPIPQLKPLAEDPHPLGYSFIDRTSSSSSSSTTSTSYANLAAPASSLSSSPIPPISSPISNLSAAVESATGRSSHLVSHSTPSGLGMLQSPSLATVPGVAMAASSPGIASSASGNVSPPLLSSTEVPVAIRAILAPPKCSYVLTGGTDRTIRYWDTSYGAERKSQSRIICGPNVGVEQPSYSYDLYDGVQVFQEEPATVVATAAGSSTTTTTTSTVGAVPSAPSNSSVASTPSPSSTRRRKQATEFPPVHHRDCITDLKALELPLNMLVSSSRDGVIKVWK